MEGCGAHWYFHPCTFKQDYGDVDTLLYSSTRVLQCLNLIITEKGLRPLWFGFDPTVISYQTNNSGLHFPHLVLGNSMMTLNFYEKKFPQVTSMHLYLSSICITYFYYSDSLHLSHIYTYITLQCSVLVSVPTHTFPCSVGRCTKVHSTRLENDPDMWLVIRGTSVVYKTRSCGGSCWSY